MPAPIQSRNPRFDAYIAGAAPFARPILAHLREVVHAACPEVVETIKWSRPFFDYRGSTLCFMSAFKAHCAFGFWRGKEMAGLPYPHGGEGMGHFGRILSLDDLPAKRELTRFVKAAMKLHEIGTKPVRAKAAPRPPPATPEDLATALRALPDASKHFDAFSPSHRREFIEWIAEAKRAETRAARVAKTVEWCAEGRTRHRQHQG